MLSIYAQDSWVLSRQALALIRDPAIPKLCPCSNIPLWWGTRIPDTHTDLLRLHGSKQTGVIEEPSVEHCIPKFLTVLILPGKYCSLGRVKN